MNNIVDSTDILLSFCDEQHSRQYRQQYYCSCHLSFCDENTVDSYRHPATVILWLTIWTILQTAQTPYCHSVKNNMNNTADSTDTPLSFCDEQYEQYCKQHRHPTAILWRTIWTILQTAQTPSCHSVMNHMNNTADSTDTLLSFCDEPHEHYDIQCRQTATLLSSDDMTASVRTTQTMLLSSDDVTASVRTTQTMLLSSDDMTASVRTTQTMLLSSDDVTASVRTTQTIL